MKQFQINRRWTNTEGNEHIDTVIRELSGAQTVEDAQMVVDWIDAMTNESLTQMGSTSRGKSTVDKEVEVH